MSRIANPDQDIDSNDALIRVGQPRARQSSLGSPTIHTYWKINIPDLQLEMLQGAKTGEESIEIPLLTAPKGGVSTTRSLSLTNENSPSNFAAPCDLPTVGCKRCLLPKFPAHRVLPPCHRGSRFASYLACECRSSVLVQSPWSDPVAAIAMTGISVAIRIAQIYPDVAGLVFALAILSLDFLVSAPRFQP